MTLCALFVLCVFCLVFVLCGVMISGGEGMCLLGAGMRLGSLLTVGTALVVGRTCLLAVGSTRSQAAVDTLLLGVGMVRVGTLLPAVGILLLEAGTVLLLGTVLEDSLPQLVLGTVRADSRLVLLDKVLQQELVGVQEQAQEQEQVQEQVHGRGEALRQAGCRGGARRRGLCM